MFFNFLEIKTASSTDPISFRVGAIESHSPWVPRKIIEMQKRKRTQKPKIGIFQNLQIQTSRIESKVTVRFGKIPSLSGSKKAGGHVCKISEVLNNVALRQCWDIGFL